MEIKTGSNETIITNGSTVVKLDNSCDCNFNQVDGLLILKIKASAQPEKQASEDTCQWKHEGCYARWPHGNIYLNLDRIKDDPYCPRCGKKIEVVE